MIVVDKVALTVKGIGAVITTAIWIRCQSKVEGGGETLEALGMGGGVAQVMLQGSDQVLQVLSLKDATVLTKAMQQVKAERDAVATDS